MGKEKTAEFYVGDTYLIKGWYNKYRFIYLEILKYLDKDFEKIVDMGCGVGFIGEELGKFVTDLDYLGIDFSEQMIARAKDRLPTLNFVVSDLLKPETHKLYKPEYTYICMEALEHITDDVAVIKSIPSGATFIFSVPNYDSQAHVRWFNNIGEIINRYKDFLEIEEQKTIKLNHVTNSIFVIKSKRKGE